MIAAGLVVIVYAFGRMLVPLHVFDIFLSHHKDHAAAQARVLKSMLSSAQCRCSVYLDSDNLLNLDDLFDTLSRHVRQFLVYLTSETLSRGWCAGEIVTATRCKLGFTVVVTPSFNWPTPEKLSYMAANIDQAGCELAAYGISLDDVSQAYTSLVFSDTSKQVRLNTDLLGRWRMQQLAHDVLGRAPPQHLDWSPTLPKETKDHVMILASRNNDEAVAAATSVLHDIKLMSTVVFS
jgi:hypothetical protein